MRAAGVGDVGDVEPAVGAAGQVPDDPGVHVPEQQVARLGPVRGALDVVEDPAHLGAGEVGGDRQAGLGAGSGPGRRRPSACCRSGPCGCPARRSRCRPALPVVLSHTTAVSRWLVMPIAASSSLVMPADLSASPTTSSVRLQTSAGSCSTQPGFGIDLLVLLLGDRDDVTAVIEDHEAGARGPLVDRSCVCAPRQASDLIAVSRSRPAPRSARRRALEVAPGSWCPALRSPR